ncbi:MAG: FKBP-type peptidyl-prolyl cis-trans isomerase [Bacteroidaceae bacterium]|nr:FKBP-type peptidyl-prolyl cis-trans isomerase [Bacteroidaceae bacterium]
MKKFAFIAAAALASFMGACTQSAPTASFQSDMDTLSYAIGMSQTMGLKDYLSMRMGMDTAYIDDFLKGFAESVKSSDDPKKTAYYAGLQIGQQVSQGMLENINRMIFGDDSTQTVNEKNLYAGFMAAVAGKETLMTVDSANAYVQANMERIQKAAREAQFGENKAAGEKFMAEVAKKEGIKELGNGVYYEVLTEGTGAVATDTTRVKVFYEGKLIDDTVFDSNLKNDEPTTFAPGQVIPGFKAALTTMPVGSKWKVYIPQDQAYGSQDMGNIKPFSALIFTIELKGFAE